MISIIIPVFNEAESLPELYHELNDVMLELGRKYEIIFINDGSSDDSRDILDRFAAQDPLVKVVHFKQNVGQTAAMMAGFDHAGGDIIVPMDGDLQHDPRDIPRLLRKLDEGYDVCSGWRKTRRDPFTRKVVSWAANKVVSFISRVPLHDYGCTLKAYKRDVIKGVKLYGEMHRFIPIYARWEGAAITEMPIRHRARRYGRSHYGLERTYKVMLDLIVITFMDRYLGKPIYLFGGVGVLNYLVAFISVAFSIYFKIWGGKTFIETPLPLLAVMAFITGTMCILMGLLAEMLIRIYYETREKRIYMVAKSRNFSSEPAGDEAPEGEPQRR